MATKSSVTGEFATLTEFDYDAFDRTQSITIGDVTTAFAYDCNDDRVVKTTNNISTEAVLDNGSISADLIGDTVKLYTDDNSVYCENGVFTYNIINSKGDLVSTEGSSTIDYKYNAYGEKLEAGNTSNPIGYRNYYCDFETGLYYLKARYYDSTTGQFTQEDTVQDDNLQYNLYGYCRGNPVLYIDPSGKSIGVFLLGGIAVLGAIVLSRCSSTATISPSGYNEYYSNKNMETQNCYGFALKQDDWLVPGFKSGKLTEYDMNKEHWTYDVNKTYDFVKADLKKYGYTYREAKKKDAPKKGEVKIALRTSGQDFHFMRKEKGKPWLHKPSSTSVLKLTKGNTPWNIGSWPLEYTINKGKSWIVGGGPKYNSKVKYLIYSKEK